MPGGGGGRGSFRIVPIERVDVYESVLAQLNGLISESGMEPGDRLPPERELVERLGVSRVSVREALRALESMGKIEIRSNAGSFLVHPNGNALVNQLKAVAPVDRAFLRYLIDVRAAVEDRVVVLVAGRSGADLAAVRDALERSGANLEESGEPGSLDLSFEAALAREAGNPLLAEMQRSVHHLWVEAWSACRIAPGDWRAFLSEHYGILEALEGGDGELARRLMAEHVDRDIEGAEEAPAGEGRGSLA